MNKQQLIDQAKKEFEEKFSTLYRITNGEAYMSPSGFTNMHKEAVNYEVTNFIEKIVESAYDKGREDGEKGIR